MPRLTRWLSRSLLVIAACTGLAACVEEVTVKVEKPPVALLVETAVAAEMDGPATVRTTGTVRARRETTLAFTTAGRVAEIAVEEGDMVRAGQRLARLDPEQVNAFDSSARAEAERAAAELARQRTLLTAGSSTRAKLEAAEATDRAARARVGQAHSIRSNLIGMRGDEERRNSELAQDVDRSHDAVAPLRETDDRQNADHNQARSHFGLQTLGSVLLPDGYTQRRTRAM